MTAQAATRVQRRIKWHRSLRAAASGLTAGAAFDFLLDLIVLPRAIWIPGLALAAAALFAAWESRVLGRLAVEAQRQAKWARIPGQAFLAKPPPAAARPSAALAGAGVTTMASMALGFARLGAAIGPCAHSNAEPVDLLVTGERVAWACPDCPADLPADWA